MADTFLYCQALGSPVSCVTWVTKRLGTAALKSLGPEWYQHVNYLSGVKPRRLYEGVVRNPNKSQSPGHSLCSSRHSTPTCSRSSKEKTETNFVWKKGGNDNNTQMMVSVYEAGANRGQKNVSSRILVLVFPHCVTLGTSFNLSDMVSNIKS